MARDLNLLVPDFKKKVEELIEVCKNDGVEMRPYYTLRTPEEQAKLWRQSRPTWVIQQKIKELKDLGAPFLASVLEDVGPQNGPHVTGALPGQSWHQYGEAVDCFWLVDGDSNWSTSEKVNGVNGYKVYAANAKKMGLTAGGNWKSFKDYPHVQLRSETNPVNELGWNKVDAMMKERFGKKPVSVTNGQGPKKSWFSSLFG